MKKTKYSSILIIISVILFLYNGCEQKKEDPAKPAQIKNTLKSVSLMQDTVRVDPAELYAGFEKVNIAIDSIGYPDAGYKLWEVISEDSLNFRFMVEGYWPDKKTYELIHNHELYKKATSVEFAAWSGLKNTWYHRFNRIEE